MKCQNCGIEEGIIIWVGNGSTLDYVHGNYEMWCERCCLKAKIEAAEKQVENLDKLKKELAKLEPQPKII